jgi:hypothetical protein
VAAFLGRNSAPAPMSPEAAARVMRAEINEVDDTVRETRMPEESAATAPVVPIGRTSGFYLQ